MNILHVGGLKRKTNPKTCNNRLKRLKSYYRKDVSAITKKRKRVDLNLKRQY